MKHYRYTGADDFLTGETALGQVVDEDFIEVQVDRLEHPWAYGWHITPRIEWSEDELDEILQAS